MSGGGHGHGGGKRRVHEEEHEEHENHERWLVSYADMMTLLMVLFIVLYAISQVDVAKFAALKTGLAAGFGAPVAMLSGADNLLDVGGAVAPDSVNLAGTAGGAKSDSQGNMSKLDVNAEAVAKLAAATQKAAVEKEVNNLQEARKKMVAALQKAGLKNKATFQFDERGLVVTIATDKVLFPSGSATLEPTGASILNTLAPTLKALPNQLSIDGHTDSIPIHTSRFESNWELSTDRATGVLRFLNAHDDIPFDRMSATGFADTKPRLPSDDPKALAANRRVEIVVLASVDNGAGRAVEDLGNQERIAPALGAATPLTAIGDPGSPSSKTRSDTRKAFTDGAKKAAAQLER